MAKDTVNAPALKKVSSVTITVFKVALNSKPTVQFAEASRRLWTDGRANERRARLSRCFDMVYQTG